MTAQTETKKGFLGNLRAAMGKKTTERKLHFKLREKLETLEARRDEAKTARQLRHEDRQLRAIQVKQVVYLSKLIPRALATQKQASVAKQQQKNGVVKRTMKHVKLIPPVLIHRDYYMFQVNTRDLPTGVAIDNLRDQKLLESLRFALQTDIQVDDSSYGGFWYLVARIGGLGIIPKLILYDDVIAMMPKRASSWALPVGVGQNKKLTHLDIRERPHILIAGATGTGKSVFLKNMILTLAMQNSPARLRIILADFKMGADFVKLQNLPHIGTPSRVRLKKSEVTDIDDAGEVVIEEIEDFADYLITEPEELMPVLNWCNLETNRRNQRFAKLVDHDITNINEYNAKFRRAPMPRILVILDEFPVAVLEVSKKEGDAIKMAISAIARKGRSAGIHIVLGTQIASAKVMDGSISQNIQTRIVGKSTGTQSQTLLGSWFASYISANKGRVAFRSDTVELELQTPWVSPKQANQLVEEIVERWTDNRDEDAAALKLFKFALRSGDGYYDAEKIYKHFPDDEEITRNFCRSLGADYELAARDGDGDQDGDNNEIEVDGALYYLLPAVPGKRPRKLITVEQFTASETKFTDSDVIKWVLDHNDGKFSNRVVYQEWRNRGATLHQIEEIGRKYEAEAIEVEREAYILESGGGNRPRRLRLVTRDAQNAANQTDPPTPQPEIVKIGKTEETEETEEINPEDDDSLPFSFFDAADDDEEFSPQGFDIIADDDGEDEEIPDWLQ